MLLVESVMVVSLVAGELATVPGVAAVEAVTLEAVIRDAELPDDVGTADDTAVATIDPPILSGAVEEDCALVLADVQPANPTTTATAHERTITLRLRTVTDAALPGDRGT